MHQAREETRVNLEIILCNVITMKSIYDTLTDAIDDCNLAELRRLELETSRKFNIDLIKFTYEGMAWPFFGRRAIEEYIENPTLKRKRFVFAILSREVLIKQRNSTSMGIIQLIHEGYCHFAVVLSEYFGEEMCTWGFKNSLPGYYREFLKFKLVRNLLRKKLSNLTRNNAATVIQKGCENWLWKPLCKDGTVGIVPRLALKQLNF